MKRLAIVAGLVAALAAPATVSAAHPSENRAEPGFGGGPHCHVNLMSGASVYPSHRAHEATGGGAASQSHVFVAIAFENCPG